MKYPTSFNERDEFGRKKIAENFIQLFKSEIDMSPAVLDGPWGCGKTEFCKKLISLIEEKNIDLTCVYVDSFKFDHSDEPLVMLASSIASILPEGKEKEKFFKKVIPVAKVLGKIFGKAGVQWILKTKLEDINKEISEVLSEEGDKLLDKGIERVFKEFEKTEETIKAFKETIEEITRDRKLLVIIDELDRCRPHFALSILEKVKHIFEVPGVKFLFSTNISQLCSVVKKQYGNEIDAENYLNKFFRFSVKLPETSLVVSGEFRLNSFELFSNAIQTKEEFKKHFLPRHNIPIFFEYFFGLNRISLREAEKFYNNVLIYNLVASHDGIKSDTYFIYALLRLLGVYIYTFNQQALNLLTNKKFSLKEIEKFFGVRLVDFRVNLDSNDTIVYKLFSLFLLDLVEQEFKSGMSELEIQKIENLVDSLLRGQYVPNKGSRVGIVSEACRILQLSK